MHNLNRIGCRIDMTYSRNKMNAGAISTEGYYMQRPEKFMSYSSEQKSVQPE